MFGTLIAGRYELRSEAGRGGMGQVWRAFDRTLQRQVAIKLIADHKLGAAGSSARFAREAQALARLQSPHIVQIFDYGVDDDVPYIAMELLEGEDLQGCLRREGRQAAAKVSALVTQIARALTAAESVQVVHGDLKPANVFLVSDGEKEIVKLVDFGVASMRSVDLASTLRSSSKLRSGTPSFMSPEQLSGGRPHRLNDLWALAVIAFEALTGELPFGSLGLADLLVGISSGPTPLVSALAPDLPHSLDAFFLRALAKDPSERFQTASDLARSFEEACRSPSGLRLLVVDDEPDMVDLIKMRFRRQIRAGTHHFQFAGNGQEALEVLDHHPDIDLVLADINMPVMDGLTLLSRLPEVAPFACTVMVSAYGDMKNIRRAMNAGAFDFVFKPIDFSDLKATVRKAAQAAEGRRALAAADEKNRILKKLTSPMVGSLLDEASPTAALLSRSLEATVVVLRVTSDVYGPGVSTDILRALNANFEVMVPVLQRHGGVVVSFHGWGALVVFVGLSHRSRALSASALISKRTTELGTLVGPESPYAQSFQIGVTSGSITAGCVGSHVCSRLGYTLVGQEVERAHLLARHAEPGQVLVSAELAASCSRPFEFTPTPYGAHTGEGSIEASRLLWQSAQLNTYLAAAGCDSAELDASGEPVPEKLTSATFTWEWEGPTEER